MVIKMGFINKGIKLVFNKRYRTIVLANKGFFNYLDDEKFLKKLFYAHFNSKLNLNNPSTYNEKIQWLKLYNRKPEYTSYVDKYRVREYVKEKIGEKYLIPLLGVWESPEEIDFELLPNQFVLKCNHNSGLGMCICTDKGKLDIKKTIEKLNKGLQQDYYLLRREWPYKNVEKKIIAEKYLVDESGYELKDYKFYCFNGEVKMMMINSDRMSDKPTKGDFFDNTFSHLNFKWGMSNSEILPQKPEVFDKMIELAEILAEGITHVRIDFYHTPNNIYFGEMTFFDGSGFDPIEPLEWDYKLGSWITLPPKSLL